MNKRIRKGQAQVTFSCPEWLFDELQMWADLRHKTTATAIRTAIQQWCEWTPNEIRKQNSRKN